MSLKKILSSLNNTDFIFTLAWRFYFEVVDSPVVVAVIVIVAIIIVIFIKFCLLVGEYRDDKDDEDVVYISIEYKNLQ